MTKSEKRLVCFAIFLVIFAFSAHWISGSVANAETKISIPLTTVNTVTHWSIINEDSTREAWKILREEYSEVAAAAILGNLHFESRMYPDRVEHLNPEQSDGVTGLTTRSRSEFIYQPHGFGLAGWTGTTNLTRLWDWCEENGYDVDSIEGQIRFLMEDYPFMAENSYKRMQLYELEDIVTATEDFRQSYEKSEMIYQSQYARAKLAKSIFASNCENIYDISTVSKAPYHFDIYMKVKNMNERIDKECILGE